MLLLLSNELLEIVVDFLDPPDILSIRLTCHRLATASQPRFDARPYRTIWTTLSKGDVETLDDSLAITTQRKEVGELLFGANYPFGQEVLWPRDEAGFLMLDSVAATRIISMLSIPMPNCTTIELHRDHCRNDQFGIPRDSTSLAPGDVLSIIFSAMSRGMQSVQHFALHLDGMEVDYGLGRLASESYSTSLFWKSWSNLQTLRLGVPLLIDGRDAQIAAKLVCKATSVTKLLLRETNCSEQAPCMFQFMVSADSFPNLTHLKVEGIERLETTLLISVLDRVQPTLTHLSLTNLVFLGNSIDLFRHLRERFATLQVLTLKLLKIYYASARRRKAYLLYCPIRSKIAVDCDSDSGLRISEGKDHLSQRRLCVDGIRYAGPEMGKILGFINDSVYLAHSPPAGLEEFQPNSPSAIPKDFNELEIQTWAWAWRR